MSRFYVQLRHPDGSLRVLVQEPKKGKLAITTIKTSGGWPRALFTNTTQAESETQKFLEERKAWSWNRTFPKYEIIILKDTA